MTPHADPGDPANPMKAPAGTTLTVQVVLDEEAAARLARFEEELTNVTSALAELRTRFERMSTILRDLPPEAQPPPMTAAAAGWETRYCRHCGAELVRKLRTNGARESRREYMSRNYCDTTCAGLARRKPRAKEGTPVTPESDATTAATEPVVVKPPARRARVRVATDRESRVARLKAARAARREGRDDGITAMQVLDVLKAAGAPVSSIEVAVRVAGAGASAQRQQAVHREVAPILSTLVSVGRARGVRSERAGYPMRYETVTS